MNFKNFYVPLNESEEDYAKQTELGKKLGLEHTGKGVYVNKSGDKYFYNKSSNTFSGWKGKLDPNNPEHHVKPSENLEARKESLEKDIKEKDLSKNKDGSDFEEYDTLRFKPREVHQRFEVHGHNFVVHDSRRSGGRGETYDKLSISHESGLPVIGGTFPKKAMEQNVEHVKKFFGDFRDHDDLKQHLNKLYSDVAHDDNLYMKGKGSYEDEKEESEAKKFFKPITDRFEKHLGEDVKKSHEKRYNSLNNGFTEKVGDRIYVDHSHFTPGGGMGAEGAVDRHNKTGRQVLFDDKENKYYLSDKVVQPYDHEAFLKRPDEQTKYKTLGGETKYTQGGHTDPYEKPKTPEDKHFSEVKKQQIEMAHNVIRSSYEKMEGAEKQRALQQLGSGNFNENTTSEHSKKFSKAGNYLKELSKSGLKQIHSELSGVPLEKKKTGKFTINLKDSEGVPKGHEIKYMDSFEIHGHEFVAHKRADYDKDGNLSLSDKVMDISHKDTGLLVRSGLDPKKRQSEIEETKIKLTQIGKEKLEQAIEKAKAK